MSIDINGISSSVAQRPVDDTQTKPGAEQQPANTETGKSSAADTVSLSDNAVSLGKVEDTVAMTPVVDAKRVEQVQAAIADGSFEADPAKIADKLMQFESLLKS